MNAKRISLILTLALVVSGFMFFAPVSQKVTPIAPVQAAWNGTDWTGTYASVMNATQDIFDLFGDMGTLLSQNVGTSLSATIQIFLFAGMVVIPLAIVLGIVAVAYGMAKGSAKKFKK